MAHRRRLPLAFDWLSVALVMVVSTDVRAATETVESGLLAEIGGGGSVAIVPSPTGLLAISADGTRKRTLTDGPIAWAMVDGRAQVIWFGRDTSIEVIDLWAAPLKVEILARSGEIGPRRMRLVPHGTWRHSRSR